MIDAIKQRETAIKISMLDYDNYDKNKLIWFQ